MATKTRKTAAARIRRVSGSPSPPLKLHDRLGLRKTVRAKLIGVSERTLSTLAGGARPTIQTARRLAESDRLLKALGEIMDDDFISEWLVTPTDAFGGLKPLEVIDRGEADRIWQMIYALRSGEPT